MLADERITARVREFAGDAVMARRDRSVRGVVERERDAAKTRDFYEATLVPLGWRRSGFQAGAYVGFKKPGAPALYFHVSDTVSATHLAFKASTAEQVAEFHRAGLATGGRDNGAPGPRPAYGQDYYAGFVYDPDGHNVEAVMGGVG